MIGTLLELRQVLQNRFLSPPELRALQERKLRAVVRHAYENVPYYISRFRAAGISPEDVHTLEDLKRIPITSKDDLRAAGPKATLAKGVDLSSCQVTTSSGTSGKPIAVCHDRTEVRMRGLVGFRALHTVGFRPWDRHVRFRPQAQPPTPLSRLGLYQTHQVSYLLPIDEQLRHLRMIKPTVLRLSPSRLRALLHHVDCPLSEIVQPRILIMSSEVFDAGLRRRVLAEMDAELFNFYVTTEFAEIASECPVHAGLHVNADQFILECLDNDDQPVEPGQPGAVVVTSLSDFTMPFIRYPLGDICTPISGQCACGSTFPLIDAPLGRQDDIVVLPSGRILPAVGLFVVVERVHGIDQYRLIQERLDRVVLQLVLWDNPGQELLSQMRAQVIEHLGEPIRFDIQIVDRLEDEEAAKFKKFISKVPALDSLD